MAAVCAVGRQLDFPVLIRTVDCQYSTVRRAIDRGPCGLLLPALLLLALPTPFALLDVTKDASLWDPSLHWPRYAFYVLILPKVLPTMALFLFAVAELFRTQIRPSFSH